MYEELAGVKYNLYIPDGLPSNTSRLKLIPTALLKVVTAILSFVFNVYPSVEICDVFRTNLLLASIVK